MPHSWVLSLNKVDLDRDSYYGNYYGKYYGVLLLGITEKKTKTGQK